MSLRGDHSIRLWNYSVENLALASWLWLSPSEMVRPYSPFSPEAKRRFNVRWDALGPLRSWLDHLEVRDLQLAHRICKLIPAQCPFERNIHLWGRHFLHIPPLCKLNPLYEQLVFLRFRALSYLADECGEDISCYCQ